jgi:hypothetical protein
MSRLLREYLALSYGKNIIKEAQEAREERKPIVLKAILQRADALNQNGRRYPREILEREIENYKRSIAEGRAGGQLDHPESSIVELKEVSHTVKEIWWEGNDVLGVVEIHPSLPRGPEALGLLEAGMKIGISSRGVGETMKDDEGNDVVDESFMLVAFDLVSEPSTQEAWLMREGKEISADVLRKSIPKEERINRIVSEILGV